MCKWSLGVCNGSVILLGMSETSKHTDRYLFLTALLPSSLSLVGVLVAATVLVGLHILLLSLRFGTFLPDIFYGYWATDYTNHVVQPLEVLINNSWIARGIELLVWGIAGLLFYTLMEKIVNFFRAWRETEDDVTVVDASHIIHHPGERGFIVRTAWRIVVFGITASLFISAQPLFRWLFDIDNRLFVHHVTLSMVKPIAGSILVWAAVMHIAIVLLRLFLFRVRLIDDK